MNVPSFAFIGFAAVVALILLCSSKPAWRRATFLVANLIFLLSFSHDPRMLAPFVGFLALGYAAIKLLERRLGRAAFGAIVVAFVLAFCSLKQYAFLPHALFLPFVYLAVGLSYVFFRILHLLIDTYEGTVDEPVPPIAYLNYTLNFTSFVAGPIQLYPEYLRSEVARPPALDLSVIASALERIVLGFSKVVVFAPIAATLQERWLAAAGAGGSISIVATTGALLAYPVFLYLNFSGYTDFVIGTARFLRLDLPENFNAPFVARGFIDFWGRWHMTLSSWFKTYVYSPLFLVLSRRFPSKQAEPLLGIFVFFVTFFLVGLWHGSGWMFVVYGVLQGVGVSSNKAYQLFMTRRLGRKPYRMLTDQPVYRACSRGLTYLYFAFTLLWFADSYEQLQAIAVRLGVAGFGAMLVLGFLAATLGIELCVRLGAALRSAASLFASAQAQRVLRIGWCTMLVLVVVSVTVVLNDPTPRIVYKAF